MTIKMYEHKGLLVNLLSVSREAAAFSEAFARKKLSPAAELSETLCQHVSPMYQRYILQIVDRVSPGNAMQDNRIRLELLFTEDAYVEVMARTASPYWFWRIVSVLAERSQALPFKPADVDRAVAELRQWMAAHYNNADLSQRAHALAAHPAADRMRASGVLYLVPNDSGTGSVHRKNPLLD